MEKYINRNAFYKELIRQGSKTWTYTKVCDAFDGKKDTLSVTERMQLLKLFKAELSRLEENIKKS